MSIHRVKFAEEDIRQLASKVPPRAPINPILDFSRYIVLKPWGNEYLMYRNNFVELWNLFIAPGKSTSMHCHPNKKTGLIVLQGEAAFSTLQGTKLLKPFDAVAIEAGAFHQTRALSAPGVRVLEVETPPAKHDLIRLRDEYGRENLAYEGLDQCLLDQGQCVRFAEVHEEGLTERSLEGCKLTIKKIGTEVFQPRHLDYLLAHDLLVILEGLVYWPGNDEIYGVAEFVQSADLLTNREALRIFNLTIMGIKGGVPVPASGAFKSIFSKFLQR